MNTTYDILSLPMKFIRGNMLANCCLSTHPADMEQNFYLDLKNPSPIFAFHLDQNFEGNILALQLPNA